MPRRHESTVELAQLTIARRAGVGHRRPAAYAGAGPHLRATGRFLGPREQTSPMKPGRISFDIIWIMTRGLTGSSASLAIWS